MLCGLDAVLGSKLGELANLTHEGAPRPDVETAPLYLPFPNGATARCGIQPIFDDRVSLTGRVVHLDFAGPLVVLLRRSFEPVSRQVITTLASEPTRSVRHIAKLGRINLEFTAHRRRSRRWPSPTRRGLSSRSPETRW